MFCDNERQANQFFDDFFRSFLYWKQTKFEKTENKMEFRFNVNEIFKNQPIVEINQTLIPPGFNGDRRGLW